MSSRSTTVDRIAKALDRIFSTDGWINGQYVYLPEDLKKIGESLARRAAEPSRFVCQGYHTTSVIQSKMLQILETDPASVIEPIVDLVTTGVARVGIGVNKVEIKLDNESLELDLEARLCDERSIYEKGLRDASGQLFDLMVMEAFLKSKAEDNSIYSFRLRPSPGCQTTGETVVKTFKDIPGRQDLVNEGSALTITDAIAISELLEGRSDGLMFHSSLHSSSRALPVLSSENLVERVKYYHKETKRPAQIAIYANRLLMDNAPETGHDLHFITALYDKNSELFYCQSLWGQTHDAKLNGIDKETMFNCMKFVERSSKEVEEYDSLPANQRYVDTVFPVKPRDWCSPLMEARKQCAGLEQMETKAFSTASGQALKKYNQDLREWEELRLQHVNVFGDSMPFDKPKPKRP